jgi:peptide deformylase
MILPIYTYGQPVLKKKCLKIEANYPGLTELISNMWETMYNASGVGLAAPQIGLPIRLFLVDSTQLEDALAGEEGIKSVMINAQKIEEFGDEFSYEEGCLSIPNIRGNVIRPDRIKIRYFDEQFNEHETFFTGINARVIQHEYDHTEGIMFTELLKPVKRRLLTKKLENIKKGRVTADYPLKVA